MGFEEGVSDRNTDVARVDEIGVGVVAEGLHPQLRDDSMLKGR
jgi:hypothetical protein